MKTCRHCGAKFGREEDYGWFKCSDCHMKMTAEINERNERERQEKERKDKSEKLKNKYVNR